MKQFTPCDIIIKLNKTKKKKLKYPRNTIKKYFFIDENQHNKMKNSAKNYITEFANIKYNKNNIVFLSIL
jgi:hypothetical protein